MPIRKWRHAARVHQRGELSDVDQGRVLGAAGGVRQVSGHLAGMGFATVSERTSPTLLLRDSRCSSAMRPDLFNGCPALTFSPPVAGWTVDMR